MTTLPQDRTAVFVVRAWLEGTANGRTLRTRITKVLDIAAPKTVVATTSNIDSVCSIIRQGLEEFVAKT